MRANRTLVDASVRLSSGHDSAELKLTWPAIPPDNVLMATGTAQGSVLSGAEYVPRPDTDQNEQATPALPSTPIRKSTQNCPSTPEVAHTDGIVPDRFHTEPMAGKSRGFPVIQVTSPSEASLKRSRSREFVGDGPGAGPHVDNDAPSSSSSTSEEVAWRSVIYSCRPPVNGPARLPSRIPYASIASPGVSNKGNEHDQQPGTTASRLPQSQTNPSSKLPLGPAQSTRSEKRASPRQLDDQGPAIQQDLKDVSAIGAMQSSGKLDGTPVANQGTDNACGQRSVTDPGPRRYSRIPTSPGSKIPRAPPFANGPGNSNKLGPSPLRQEVKADQGSRNGDVPKLDMESSDQSLDQIELDNLSAHSPPDLPPPASINFRSFSDPTPSYESQGQQRAIYPIGALKATAMGKESGEMTGGIDPHRDAPTLNSHLVAVEFTRNIDEMRIPPHPARLPPSAPTTTVTPPGLSSSRQPVSKDVQTPGNLGRNNPNGMRGTIKKSIGRIFQKHEKGAGRSTPNAVQDKKPSSSRIPKTPSIIDRFIPSGSMRGRNTSKAQTTMQTEKPGGKKRRLGEKLGTSDNTAERLKMLEIAQVCLCILLILAWEIRIS